MSNLSIFFLKNRKKTSKWKKVKKMSKKVLTSNFEFGILLVHSEKIVQNDLWKLSKKVNLSSLDKLRIKIWLTIIFLLRVWSWLRMNAGGMPKTCKSNEGTHWRWSACTKPDLDFSLSGKRVSNTWVTCLKAGDNVWKRTLIPNVLYGVKKPLKLHFEMGLRRIS